MMSRMRIPLIVLMLGSFTSILWSDPSKKVSPEELCAKSKACAADPAWITHPSYPAEVADKTSFCSFEQFAWQAFLDLVQPTSEDPNILEFETWMPYYGIFVAADEQPVPYGQHPPDPCGGAASGAVRAIGTDLFIYSALTKQAGSLHALIDPQGNDVWYGLRVNKPAYDMLTGCDLYRSNCAGPLNLHSQQGKGKVQDIIKNYPHLAFPNGAVELKTSWKILSLKEKSSGLFYTVSGRIQSGSQKSCQTVDLGLVGIHIVSKTEDFPAFIWASFEHRNNAPPCTDLDTPPPLGGSWNFFDRDECKNCETNAYNPPKPTQVCRMHPQGDSTIGIFPNGQNCELDPLQFACRQPTQGMLEASTQAICGINNSAQKMILAQKGKIDPVWANYELVGNIWTENKVLSPPALSAQVGSLSAANTTMETYVQNGGAGVTPTNNCFSCHNQSSASGELLPPAGLSHIFVKTVPNSGGCSNGSLPASCKQYYVNKDQMNKEQVKKVSKGGQS